jgi:broad specificity phosphatase PhoE
MKTIIFIRHGEATSNITHTITSDFEGYPLTDLGRTEVTMLAATLDSMRIDGFYTSPVLRAIQTAQIISEKCRIRPKVDKRLMERSMGRLGGLRFISREQENDAVTEDVKSGYRNGVESWESIEERVKSFIDSAENGLVMAVSHHDAIMAALGLIDGRYRNNDTFVKVSTGSATTIDFENRRIIGINSKAIPVVTA